jgi:hypothetical protein
VKDASSTRKPSDNSNAMEVESSSQLHEHSSLQIRPDPMRHPEFSLNRIAGDSNNSSSFVSTTTSVEGEPLPSFYFDIDGPFNHSITHPAPTTTGQLPSFDFSI